MANISIDLENVVEVHIEFKVMKTFAIYDSLYVSIIRELLAILSNDLENEVKGQMQGHENIRHI